MKKGITVAGNIIADIIKMIDLYPEKGRLSTIYSVSKSVGGCVPNTGVTLARLGGVPVKASAKAGADENGRFILDLLQKEGIDIGSVSSVAGADTSFTDVMTVQGTGERTFFNTKGTNASFCPADVDANARDCSIFHIGYILLLDAFDAADSRFGTVLAGFLHDLQEKGIKTSIDVVSNSADRFREKVLPALKYSDYAVLNEIEAGLATGIEPRRADGSPDLDRVERIARAFLRIGVKKAVIHCPEGGFCADAASGAFTAVPSLLLPRDYIKGAVGAGDAFSAGFLYAAYKGFSDGEALEFASLTAAANLSSYDSIGGARAFAETTKLGRLYPRRSFN
ncbi:sugar kinase [Clostridia bacterium]|nr:sugar kinase [Clostridia bacterium]